MGVKRPRYEVDHSIPSITKIKDHWIYTFTPDMVFKRTTALLSS
jgi:hypothetical protein